MFKGVISIMKLGLLGLVLMSMGCASCQFVKDQAVAPAELNQNRLIMNTNGQTEVGIHGTTTVDNPIYIRSYGRGTVTIRGLRECGYITSGATEKAGWIKINPKNFPNKEICLYAIQERTENFDAPIIGHILIRRFLDPNIVPLKISVNNVVRKGVNWVQLKEDDETVSITSYENQLQGGINESRDIVVYLGDHAGKLNITGCNLPANPLDYDADQKEMLLTVDYLYRNQPVNKSCIFTLTANHDDALKESASIFVKVYKGTGSFLDVPVVDGRCFKFVDPYVIGISVNGSWKNSKEKCVEDADEYKVEGTTSKHRIFYGIFNGLEWTVMK